MFSNKLYVLPVKDEFILKACDTLIAHRLICLTNHVTSDGKWLHKNFFIGFIRDEITYAISTFMFFFVTL